jgi:hypothetical protein
MQGDANSDNDNGMQSRYVSMALHVCIAIWDKIGDVGHDADYTPMAP